MVNTGPKKSILLDTLLEALPLTCLLIVLGTFVAMPASAQQRTVSGTVTDAQNGNPLPGVNVRVVGTQIGVATDAEGGYELGVPSTADSLQFTFVGYEPQIVPVQGRSTIDVALEQATLTGQEVVVTGYSAQQRQDLTGSVSVVNTQDLQELPESQITDQLQGMASGLSVISSGQPGSDPQIRIRGVNTFGNNKPLFVVDGIQTQTIDDLNPSDIAEIQVLKDASAASVYGARASNGVVIIETTQGEGDVSVSFNHYTGLATQPDESNPFELLDPQGRADLEWLAFQNSGQDPTDPQYGSGEQPELPDFVLPTGADEGDSGTDPSEYFLNPFYTDGSQLQDFTQIVRANKAGTDWFDELMRTGAVTKTDLTVSGGGDQGSYLFGVGYLNEEGTMLETFLERYSLRANTTYNVTDDIRIGENLSYTIEENRTAQTLQQNTAVDLAYRMRPIVPVRDIMGNWAGTAGNGLGNAENPVANRRRTRNDQNLSQRVFGNAFLEIDILDPLQYRTSFGGDYDTGFLEEFQFPSYENSENSTTNALYERQFTSISWQWTHTLNFQYTFGQSHNLDVLAGVEWREDNFRFSEEDVQQFFTFDPDFVNLGNGTGTRSINSGTEVRAIASQFGKVDYNYDGKYFLGASVRRDGSSVFLEDRYGIFPAGSVGWRISEESFFPDGFVTSLKFRGSYGVLGNQINVTPNNAYSLFGSNQFAYDIGADNGGATSGFSLSQIGAADAQWEENTSLNIGADISLLDGRVDATVDYYRKTVSDLLFNPELAGTEGRANPPFINVAEMENNGIDASVNSQAQVGGVEINANANFTSYNNEITSITEGVSSFSEDSRRFQGQDIVRNEVGEEISSYYGFQVVGFWDSEQEIEQANQQAPDGQYQLGAAPGRFRYEDVNGDGEITTADRTHLGSPNPDFTYGVNLSFRYENWDLNVSVFGREGAQVWNQVRWWTDFFSSFNGNKSEAALNDSWTPDNQDASLPIQELGRSFSTNNVPNSHFVEDADYLRIQNLQLGYSLPSSLIQGVGIENLRIYVQGSNVLTITGYSNPDPEIGSNDPSDVTSFGIDEGSYPTPREFIAGVNLTF